VSRVKLSPFLLLCAIPVFILCFSIFGPYLTDSVYSYSALGIGLRGRTLPGYPTIDPNIGVTSHALGMRAAQDILSGRLPLWNHYEGLGAPLLGGMQSAALFPPTLLLALPHGQAIEHCLLQLIGGLGAFLFFRRFGLGVTAALVGGVLYELNGVFAWLRNAVFNPVAFLPWLFFAFESMRCAVLAKEGWRVHFPIICLGAVAGSLALYAGFPEEVYLYVLLLTAWGVFRCVGLSGRQLATFAGIALASICLGLALSAPCLVAFVEFLKEADLASHGGEGFYGQWLPPNSLVQYLLPYVFGPIFATFDQGIAPVWGAIGGYAGLLPVMAAVGSLLTPGRRKEKFFLAGWIVVALGATHGWPGIYFLFMQLPLAKMAACYRYLNISWIFCTIFLAAIFIDQLPGLEPHVRRRVAMVAAGLSAVCVLGTVWMARANISKLWLETPHLRFYFIAAVLIALSLCAAAHQIARNYDRPGNAKRLYALLIGEAALWFLMPFLSYPRRGQIDREAVTFLQSNIGLQRVVSSKTGGSTYGISPNYGSYFSIPTLNFDDLPVPRRSVAYIHDRLDGYVSRIFLPWYPGLPKEEDAKRQDIFRERLDRYAQAGVKYVLAGDDYGNGLTAVYKGKLFTVYEMPNTRGYFTAPLCNLKPQTHDIVEADCSADSSLLRLETHMKGWSADVNGRRVKIALTEGIFQTISLPAGKSLVSFQYEPPGIWAAIAAAAGAGLLCIFGLFLFVTRGRHSRAHQRSVIAPS
jgi:hypothetical protein